jgi:hypothetical protein
MSIGDSQVSNQYKLAVALSSTPCHLESREFAQKDVCNEIENRDIGRAGSNFLGKHDGGRGGRTVGASQTDGRRCNGIE